MFASYDALKREYENLKKLSPDERKMILLENKIIYETHRVTGDYFQSSIILPVLSLILLSSVLLVDAKLMLITILSVALLILISLYGIWLTSRRRKSVRAFQIMSLLQLIEENEKVT